MVSVENVSTKAVCYKNDIEYRFRLASDIQRFTGRVVNGTANKKPVYSSSRGFVSTKCDVSDMSQEMKEVQNIYKKEKGLRVRGEIARIDKNELGKNKKKEIADIADSFAGYYMARGFQNAYGIYDEGDNYAIWYAINSVSYADGSKYKRNDYEIRVLFGGLRYPEF